MSDAPTTIPCHQLAAPALIARVAASMTGEGMCPRPPFALRPGFCCFCDHPLPYEFSGFHQKDGETKEHRFSSDSPGADKIQVQEGWPLGPGIGFFWPATQAATPLPTSGLHRIGDRFPPILLAAQTCCDALTTDIFNAASRKCREKTAAIVKAGQTKAMAHELAQKENARKAARAMGRQFASTTGNDNEAGSF